MQLSDTTRNALSCQLEKLQQARSELVDRVIAIETNMDKFQKDISEIDKQIADIRADLGLADLVKYGG
jgi:predicted  nucleic acid-binding Zn-ribbon protein